MYEGIGFKKALLLGIGVGVVLPIVFFFVGRIASAKERNYVNNGKLTSCFVETVVNVGGKQQVYVVYADENGNSIRAKAVLNKRVVAGETVEAYVLKSDPYEVFYPATSFWKWAFYAIVAVAAIASWIPLILEIRKNKFEKMLARAKEFNRMNRDIE